MQIDYQTFIFLRPSAMHDLKFAKLLIQVEEKCQGNCVGTHFVSPNDSFTAVCLSVNFFPAKIIPAPVKKRNGNNLVTHEVKIVSGVKNTAYLVKEMNHVFALSENSIDTAYG